MFSLFDSLTEIHSEKTSELWRRRNLKKKTQKITVIKVLRLLAPRPVHVAAIRKNNDAECKLLSDIMAEGPSWSRIAPKKTDRTKNKTKQTKHKIGFINECNAFFLHFPFLFLHSFICQRDQTKCPPSCWTKKKYEKKYDTELDFETWSEICSNPIRMICISNLPAIKCLCLSKQELPCYFFLSFFELYIVHTNVPFSLIVFFLAFLDSWLLFHDCAFFPPKLKMDLCRSQLFSLIMCYT